MAYSNANKSKRIRLANEGATLIPTVYTDGACRNNGRGNAKAGYGVYWGDNHPDNVSAPLVGTPTNNRAEYMAIIHAIKQARDRGYKELRVCTDSMLIINSMTLWLSGWRRNNWKKKDGSPVLNCDLIKELSDLMKEVNVHFEHVNGHAGIHGNEMADKLAVAGASLSGEMTIPSSSTSSNLDKKMGQKVSINGAEVADLTVPDFEFLHCPDCDVLQNIRQRATKILSGDKNILRKELKKLIACVDLTTLAGDDTRERVQNLAKQAAHPIPKESKIRCAAVCVYPLRVRDVVECLSQQKSQIAVAAVAGGFPSGQYHLKSRLLEIQLTLADGATEIDVVINRAAVLDGDWKTVIDELCAMRAACDKAHLKVILAVGELKTYTNVYRASWAAMLAGADFIKTSTGKEMVNATLPYAYVMIIAIRDFQREKNRRVGFKAAGGIRTVEQALQFAAVPVVVFGENNATSWSNPNRFRIGASSLLKELLNALSE